MEHRTWEVTLWWGKVVSILHALTGGLLAALLQVPGGRW